MTSEDCVEILGITCAAKVILKKRRGRGVDESTEASIASAKTSSNLVRVVVGYQYQVLRLAWLLPTYTDLRQGLSAFAYGPCPFDGLLSS